MKYLKITIAIIFVASFYFVYLFIPNKIVIAGIDNFPKSAYALYDGDNGITEVQYWDKWMPFKQKDDKTSTLIFENFKLRVDKGGMVDNAKSILESEDIESKLTISAFYDTTKALTTVNYDCTIDNNTLNPIKRIQNFYAAKKFEKQINEIIQAAKIYYEKNKNANKLVFNKIENFPKSAYGEKGITEVQYWDKWMPYKQKDDSTHTLIFENCTLRVDKGGMIDNAKSILRLDGIEAKLTISAFYDAENEKASVLFQCSIDRNTLNPINRGINSLKLDNLNYQIKEIMQAAKVYYSKQP
jgi:hypothetical protein